MAAADQDQGSSIPASPITARKPPLAFIVSPPGVGAAARVRQYANQENLNPSFKPNQPNNPHQIAIKQTTLKKLDDSPSSYDTSLSLLENMTALGLDSYGDEDLQMPEDDGGRLRRILESLVQRVAHLNQRAQEVAYENHVRPNQQTAHDEKLIAMRMEQEQLEEANFQLMDRLKQCAKEKLCLERKAKSNYMALEKKFNAIKFKDKQYKNEIRKREIECERVQKKLRGLVISDRSTINAPVLKSCLPGPSAKGTAQRVPIADKLIAPEEMMLLQDSVSRLETRIATLTEEGVQMREFITSVVEFLDSCSDADKGFSWSVKSCPFNMVREQLVSRFADFASSFNKLTNTDDIKTETHQFHIAELEEAAEQEQLIQRALYIKANVGDSQPNSELLPGQHARKIMKPLTSRFQIQK
uniref:Uncharacterized protein n=1 Tax=Spongospora subterranea TaxID=70186 RepID=A0A0H5QGW2_9EUKA|eukprot:CRZ00847.1 hypothetical protein [Spongospora subterranea]